MSQMISSSNVFHIVKRVAESPTHKKRVLREELTNLRGVITDKEIWEITDFFRIEKARPLTVIEAVVESGAQSPESTLRLLKSFGHKEELCQKALNAYEDSMYFREQLFSAIDTKPLLKKRLENFAVSSVSCQVC